MNIYEQRQLERQKEDEDADDTGLRENPYVQRARSRERELESDWSKLPSNILPSAENRAADFVNMLFNMPETLKAGGELMSGLVEKGGRKLAELTTGEKREPRGNREQVADAAIEALDQRYGSLERARHTAITDPTGAALDITSILSPAARAARVPSVGGAFDVVGGAGKGIQALLRKGEIPAPERMYASSIGVKPSTMMEGSIRPSVQMGMREKIGGNEAGYTKLTELKDQAGAQINKIIAEAAETNQPIPRTAISKYLKGMIKDGRYNLTLGELKSLQKMLDDFNTQFGEKLNLFPEEVQAWKTSAYERAYAAEASPEPTIAKSVGTKADRKMAKGAKEQLETRFPDIKKPNKQWGETAQLEPYIKKRMDKEPDWSLDNIHVEVLKKLPRDKIAWALDRIAKGDMGTIEKVFNTREIRSLLEMAARNNAFFGETFEEQK